MSQHSGAEIAARLAQLAKAAVEIIKGALSGGLAGAAVGAVKAFLPQIIKAVLYILAFCVMLMLVIFVALPSAMFGFDSVTDDEIVWMNTASAKADSLYESFGELTKSEARSLLDELSEGYDEVSSTNIDELEDLGYNWAAAITSVLHQQDLNLINEMSVRSVARLGINYTTEKESYEETEVHIDPDTGEETAVTITKKRLSVNMSLENADRLMEKLNFTDFQKEWAYFIYQNLEERQYSPSDNNNQEYEDYGEITFQNGTTEIVYYNQRDKRWADKKYGTSDTIGESGCGPTALAIVVSSFTENKLNPKEMSDWAYENGYYIPHGGSYHSLIPEGASRFGLTVEAVSKKQGQKIVDALAEGKLVVAIMGKGVFTSSGHFIVLRGVTEEGKILVADPYSINFTNREWDFSIILNEASKKAAGNKPFWIISK